MTPVTSIRAGTLLGTARHDKVEEFLQSDFKRLVQEAGVEGARVHMEQAITVDYEKALREIAACLRSATVKVAEPSGGGGVLNR